MSKVWHVGPAKHGIAAYDLQIEAIYRQQGFEVEPVLVEGDHQVAELAERLAKETVGLCHFEIGSGDGAIFRLSQQLLRRTGRRQLATIHDPGVVVRHPLAVPFADSRIKLVGAAAKAVRKVVTRVAGPSIVRRYLDDPRVYRIYLRPDLAETQRSFYLPQPTYHADQPAAPGQLLMLPRVGFGGYWGQGKGLETLIEATRQARSAGIHFSLVLGGGAADSDDHYARSMRQQAKAVEPNVELPGFVADEDLEAFLQGLSALVLPYWPELPNGTSAMAMRAAELGVPVIASDTPALRGQLGAEGAAYVTPKDPAALCEAIEQLVSSGEKFRTRALATQKRIFANHNWSAVGARLHMIVTEVMGDAS